MQSRLTIAGHPIQPMLVTFPFGLFACGVLLDIGAVLAGRQLWLIGDVGYWTIIAGLAATGLATLAGLVDLWDQPFRTGLRRTVLAFTLVSVATAGLFVLVCLARSGVPHHAPTPASLALELAALGVGAVGVWLGARLVRQLGEASAEARHPVPVVRRGEVLYRSRSAMR